MRRGSGRRWLRRAMLVASAVVLSYVGLLLRPQLVFAHETRSGNVVLHSRAALPPRALDIAERARQRAARSPFYDHQATYDVFFCDTPTLFALFARNDYRVGGVASGLTHDIFLRPAHVDRDRIVGPSGVEASGDRTLTYFIAHEITHVMVMRRVGLIRYLRLRTWQREGYADYVAKAGAFDSSAALLGLRTQAPELDPRRSGLYDRYHLLVAYMLDHEGMTPEDLMAAPIDPLAIEGLLAG